MKITLISPKTMVSCSPPLGLAYIAAVLRENDYKDVNIIDLNVINNENKLEKIIEKKNPDIVGITFMTANIKEAENIASLVKKHNKDTTVITGGVHPSIMPQETLKNKNIDIVAIGEGEYTFLDIVNSIDKKKPLNKVKGIYYKNNGIIKKTEPRKYIENLDELPYPARDLLPMNYYLSNIPEYPMIMPVTQLCVIRGCPFNCSFCQPTSKKMFGTKVRSRHPENILDEIEYLIKKYKLGAVNLNADTLTANKKWIYTFCDTIKERNLDFNWNNGTRVNTVTRDIIKKMSEAGCYFTQFGVESGSQRILDKIMNKGITIKQTKNAFKWCHEFGIITGANIMIGSPTETRYDLYLTYKLLKQIKPDIISAYVTNPLPGTYLYDYAKSKNLIKTNDLTKLQRHSTGTMKREIDDEDIEKYTKLLWYLSVKRQTKNILSPFKKNKILKHSLKREINLLKTNPTHFMKNLIRKPVTSLAIRKYELLEHNKTVKMLMNHEKPKNNY